MFTGIIQDIGIITDIVKKGDWLLTITTDALSLDRTPLGASIACSGICLTVVSKKDRSFQVQASAETLNKTTLRQWQKGTQVNLEPALHMGDEIGGHLVTGHIDGTATVTSQYQEGDSWRIQFTPPLELHRFLARKGSTTIDGVALTINNVDKKNFDVNIIPYTQKKTTLGDLKVGSEVNIEIDMIARYVDRLLASR